MPILAHGKTANGGGNGIMKYKRTLTSVAIVTLVLVSLCAVCVTVTSLPSQPTNTSTNAAKSVPDKILVRFRPSIAANAAAYIQASDAASASIGATVIKQYAFVPGLEVVKLPPGISVNDSIAAYQKSTNVTYAEPDFIYSVNATTATLPATAKLPLAVNHSGSVVPSTITPNLFPNDPYYQYQWAYPDINAPGAWDKTTGSASTIIADVDTGVDASHPDLAANLLPLVNFVPDMTYDSDHGTHTAGIIGAVGNNGIGVAGTDWHTSILPLEAGNASYLPDDAIISAWQYASNYGATIINNSFGGSSYSQAMKDAIDACPQCLFVCAAGNNASNNDAYPFYPASFSSPNIISVASIDSGDTLSSFSNYGATSVDLGAPGGNILSTIWMNETGFAAGYGYKSGTSMATPYVTGVAGLIKTVNPSLSVADVKNAILNNVDPDSYLSGKVLTGGRLDAAKAVNSGGLIVTAVDPANNAVNVPITKTVNVAFNQMIQQGANYSSIALKQGSANVNATTAIAGTNLTIKPNATLAGNTTYNLTVPHDAVKNGTTTLTTDFTSTFTTVAAAPVASGPAVSAPDGNDLALFVKGADNYLYWKQLNSTTGWTGWQSLGGILTSDPAATSRNTGGITVFARGSDGAVWYRDYVGGSWGNWVSIGGQIPVGTGPAVSSWGAGRLDVFARGTDGAVWHKSYDTATSWSSWQSLGGILTSSPAATSRNTGGITVFARGSDGAVWYRDYVGGSWGNWVSIGGQIPVGTGPAVSSWGAGRLDVFARGTDGAMWHKTYTGTSWSSWQSLGGVLTSSPAATSPGTGLIDVFARLSDNYLWEVSYSNNAWSTWLPIGGM